MKKNYLLLLTFLVSILGFSQTSPEKNYKTNEIIVLLKPEAFANKTINLSSKRSAKELIGLEQFDKVSQKVKATEVNYTLKQSFKYPKKAKKLGLDRFVTIKISENSDIESIMKEYQSLDNVELVEPNYITKAEIAPNDPLYYRQWAANNTGNARLIDEGTTVGTPGADLNLEEAWDIHTGKTNNPVIIAILDTGVEGTHPEFSDRMVEGYNYIEGNTDTTDFHGHGTQCAGIAAADGNNGIGIAGVNWGAKIMPIKVLGDDGKGKTGSTANGIMFAVDNGADVISMSLSSSIQSTLTKNAIEYAYEANVPAFAARGNQNSTEARYPASNPRTIAVGALSPCNTRKSPTSCDGEEWWGSNYGGGPDAMDFLAPGVKIYTTYLQKDNDLAQYKFNYNGTSAATPYAAGIASLMKSMDPSLSIDEIRTIMRNTAVDIGSSGYDDETGFGRLDAAAALRAVGGTTEPTPTACGTTISSYPYNQGFESGTGWTQVSTDDGDWSRTSGSTPSASTGPTEAAEGSYYHFLEASTNDSTGEIGSNATAILESPCFNLSNKSSATFSFKNHMYGDNIGTLVVQVSSNEGQSWSQLWSNTGDQGNQWNTINVNLNDYIGNTVKIRIVGTTGSGWRSDIAIDDLSVTTGTNTPVGCSNVVIASDDFESGWGIWNDGGSDARRNVKDAPYSNGSYSIRLRDNTETSVMTTDNLNLSSFEEINVSFSYYTRSMDNANEDFWLQISDDGGATFTTLEEWNLTDEFVNNTFYSFSVEITGDFSATTKFRFRCDASGNSDWVYIDDVEISGCTTGTNSASQDATIDDVTTTSTITATASEITEPNLADIKIYPNPVVNILRLTNITSKTNLILLNVNGQVVYSGTGVDKIDVSNLKSGIYILKVSNEFESKAHKILKN
ncbi:S8 family serine peptidase [uncultured Polaribacter sp.]|uniref:S8 family serine peptidase n=1 Tax=uncultured Polaribacter sp. TaxID=174711 RepID=UPI002637250F|nr:S8 family serine peptidase [uncultured Polaribacter sp.]